ncbi:MAG: 50S ribosomal protein L10 [Actinobacteria bacterium]|nr:50S ribosomal protein L10 [Actinomycetota bacterium]
MSTVRSEKEAVVAEVRGKLESATAVIVTEYRGLTVPNLASLRTSLRGVGAEYRVYKNTLARFAARESGIEGLESLLTGPTALAFVDGDVAAVAKTLTEYAKTNPLLVIRGGAVAGKAVTATDVEMLADLPPREVMLAQFAGLMQAPLVKTAGLLQALPRNMAYGLKALVDQKTAA